MIKIKKPYVKCKAFRYTSEVEVLFLMFYGKVAERLSCFCHYVV